MDKDDLPHCLQKGYRNAANAIFERCELQLPWYAVPSFVFPLGAIPSTANDKLDERRIASIYSDIVAKNLERHFRRSANETSIRYQSSPLEEAVAALWESILPYDLPACRIPLDQHFFAAGGNSMSVIKLSAAARQSGYSLSVADIFAHPTIRAQARVLMRVSTPLSTDQRVSTAQRSFWLLLALSKAGQTLPRMASVKLRFQSTKSKRRCQLLELKSRSSASA